MKEYDDVLMTGAEQEAIGLKVFDIVSVTGAFADKYPATVTQFMQITEDENTAYNNNPSVFYAPLSKAAGMDEAATIDILGKFTFLTVDTELSAAWMGGGIADFIKNVADFYVESKQLDVAMSRDDYAKKVDSSFLQSVK